MTNPPPAPHGRLRTGLGFTILLSAALSLTGCAQWTYDHTDLGMALRDAERNIPAELRLRSDHALAYLDGSPPKDVDAVVFLLTPDGLVSGKLVAAYRPAAWPLTKRTYKLTAEFDLRRSGLAGLAPLDLLRSVADDLTRVRPEQSAGVAHAWVAAGLVRAQQSLPGSSDVGPAYPRLTDVLELVPANGETRIASRGEGVCTVEYAVSIDR